MSEESYNEKDEKEEEKKYEKSWEEKRRRDPLATLGWALVLIWAGVVLLIENFNLLDNIAIGFIADLEAWSLIFVGAGLIVLALVVVRLLVPEYRGPVTGNIIFAFILVGIGLGETVGWGIMGALILIALGISYLVRGFFRGG
jgi:vacuolar-type H+-ATPase subunit I/STV1